MGIFDDITPEQLEQERLNKLVYENKLKSLGYRLDSSLYDWELLMNNPELFGANWKELAKENYDIGTDFITFIKTYVK